MELLIPQKKMNNIEPKKFLWAKIKIYKAMIFLIWKEYS